MKRMENEMNKNMKILVPLNNADCIDAYIKAGADEFYMGFYDNKWTEKYGIFSDINRMSGFGEKANKYTFDEVLRIAAHIKKLGKGIFITLNANCYSAEQLNYIETCYFPMFISVGIDGIIVSDINLVRKAVKNRLPATVSTMGAVYNSDIAKEFVYEGVKRIILPRDMSLEEMNSVIRNCPGIEFEVFHMRNGCIFSDSYCLGMHRPECGSTCGYVRYREEEIITDYTSFIDKHDIELNDFLYNTAFHADACAMCALYSFKTMGISSLKIVGRADITEGVCRDIEITKKNLEIVYSSNSKDEYLRKMIFPDNTPQKCRLGLSCYYPEERFGAAL